MEIVFNNCKFDVKICIDTGASSTINFPNVKKIGKIEKIQTGASCNILTRE